MKYSSHAIAQSRRLLSVGGLLAVLAGCAGVGIVATSDPMRKLDEAQSLAWEQGRALPAETLIREAITIFREQGDERGLGHAYRTYGEFLRSPSITRWGPHFAKNGFQDKSITLANRAEKSEEFFNTALDHYARAEAKYQSTKEFGVLSNVYYNMGWSNYRLGKREVACQYYDKAVLAQSQYVPQPPISAERLQKIRDNFHNTVAEGRAKSQCPV